MPLADKPFSVTQEAKMSTSNLFFRMALAIATLFPLAVAAEEAAPQGGGRAMMMSVEAVVLPCICGKKYAMLTTRKVAMAMRCGSIFLKIIFVKRYVLWLNC